MLIRVKSEAELKQLGYYWARDRVYLCHVDQAKFGIIHKIYLNRVLKTVDDQIHTGLWPSWQVYIDGHTDYVTEKACDTKLSKLQRLLY